MKRDLPDGWEACLTDVGKVYYINHNTNMAQWETPLEYQRIDRRSVDRSAKPPLQVDTKVRSTEISVGRYGSINTLNAKPPPIAS
jgi:hypothetical protein